LAWYKKSRAGQCLQPHIRHYDLRTPLNAIIGFSEILRSELFGPLGHARYKEYARDIHGAGKHLLVLINDILDLSKAEAGKFELVDEEIVTPDLLRECLRLMRGRAEEAGLMLEAPCGRSIRSRIILHSQQEEKRL
jgi:signal transduction histidine kinase